MSAQNVGKRAEEIVYWALLLAKWLGFWPDWFLSVRPGRKSEDANGCDLVIMTDVGMLGLQVKSSPAMTAKHREKYKKNGIPVIFVPREVTSLIGWIPADVYAEFSRWPSPWWPSNVKSFS